jgi:glycine dehydrogenase subunit 1
VRDRAGEVAELLEHARNHGVLAGIDLNPLIGRHTEGSFTGLPERYRDCFLVAVTEKRSRAEIEQWARTLYQAPQTAAC